MSKILAKVHVRRLPGQMRLCLQYMQGGKLVFRLLDQHEKPVKGVSACLEKDLFPTFLDKIRAGSQIITIFEKGSARYDSIAHIKLVASTYFGIHICPKIEKHGRKSWRVFYLWSNTYWSNAFLRVGAAAFSQALREMQRRIKLLEL